MTAVAKEMFNSRRGDAESREREFLVTESGSDLTEQAAIEAALAAAPSELDDMVLVNASISKHVSNTMMKVAVQYGVLGQGSPLAPPGTSEYEFNYQAESEHIDYSIATVVVRQKNVTAAMPSNFFGHAIRVPEQGKLPEGVDLPAGNTTNVWTFTINGKPSQDYERLVEGLMGCVNISPFKNRPIGSMRFVQCQSNTIAGNKTQIRFGMQYSANVTNLEIVSGLVVPEKRGHDYMWVQYKKAPNGAHIVPSPEFAVVEQVFRYGDLNQLGF